MLPFLDPEQLQRWWWLWQLAWFVQAGMTIWMLYDAYHRGVEAIWFWLIFLFQPFGAWVYLFAVKLRSRGDLSLGGWQPFQKRVSLKELRYRAQQSPTQANHAALADALVEKQEYQEAIPHLEAVLRHEPEYGRALHGIALCHVELARPADALPHLKKLLAKDERWSDYEACRLLVRALAAQGSAVAALASCRELARKSPSTHHLYLLVERLHAAGQAEEADRVLAQLLEEYQYASGRTRRLQRTWAKKARQLQKERSAR